MFVDNEKQATVSIILTVYLLVAFIVLTVAYGITNSAVIGTMNVIVLLITLPVVGSLLSRGGIAFLAIVILCLGLVVSEKIGLFTVAVLVLAIAAFIVQVLIARLAETKVGEKLISQSTRLQKAIDGGMSKLFGKIDLLLNREKKEE